MRHMGREVMHHSLRWDTNGRDGLGLKDAGGTQSRPEGAHLFDECGSGKGQDKIHHVHAGLDSNKNR